MSLLGLLQYVVQAVCLASGLFVILFAKEYLRTIRVLDKRLSEAEKRFANLARFDPERKE